MEKAMVKQTTATPLSEKDDKHEGPLQPIHNKQERKRQELVGKSKNNKVTFEDEIIFEDGTAVILSRIIEEGEFSTVFVARHARTTCRKQHPMLFALKRIQYNTAKNKQAVQQEVAAHDMFCDCTTIMPLLGVKFSPNSCDLLFPFVKLSLEEDIVARRLLQDTCETKRKPYSKREILVLLGGITRAIGTMHDAGWSHRDIKTANVLLQKETIGGNKNKRHSRFQMTPLLTDFGSVGPLAVPLTSWADVLTTTEHAERHTTLAFCAPELRAGGLAYGTHQVLHYDYADIWSLGCLLFAIMYGSSPFETEWRVSLVEGAAAEGTVRIVDCTVSKLLEPVPFPPAGSAADKRYPGEKLKDLIRAMLKKEGRERPSAANVEKTVEELLLANEEGNDGGGS